MKSYEKGEDVKAVFIFLNYVSAWILRFEVHSHYCDIFSTTTYYVYNDCLKLLNNNNSIICWHLKTPSSVLWRHTRQLYYVIISSKYAFYDWWRHKNDIFRKKIKVTPKLILGVVLMQTLKDSVFDVLKMIF